MKDNFFFSIICPTFNSGKFIEKNLFSILNQTYSNFEIIYSDDGSTDNTLELIKDYKKYFFEKKIKIEVLENNHKGPGAARNFGIKKANFDWIAFIDSDDEWDKDKLKKINQVIQMNKNYNCISHNEIFRKKDGKEIKFNYKKFFSHDKLVYKQLFLKNFLSTSSVTLKKELIINAGYFDEELSNAQDYDLWLKIGDNFSLYFIDEYLGFYNERDDNITSRSYSKKITNLIKILKKNKKNVSKYNYYYKLLRILLSKEWLK